MAATCPNSASIGSISGEWEACETRSRRVRTVTCRAISSTTDSTPEITTEVGVLTAAMATWSSRPSMSGNTSASDAAIASIAPPAGSACISLARAATSVQASAREKTPATWAAAISPTEWPVTTSGLTPRESSRRVSATSKAKRAGWVISVSSSTPAGSVNIASRSGYGNRASSRAQISSSASANTGKAPARSRPMPSRWLPCPVNSRASLPPWPPPVTTPGAAVRSASARRPASSSSRSVPTTTARCSSSARSPARAAPVAAIGVSCVVQDASCSACARSASGVLAEISHGVTGSSTASASASASAGPCSMITCALVPLMPKEEIAARRGRSSTSHERASVSSSTAPAVQSTCGDGSSTCSVRGSVPCRIAITILITPPTPAAAWA